MTRSRSRPVRCANCGKHVDWCIQRCGDGHQDAGTTKDLAINSNWLDYGGCSINYASNGLYKTGMQANNNRFGRAQRVSGCAIIHNSTKSDLVPTGNVWDDNGQPVTPSRGK